MTKDEIIDELKKLGNAQTKKTWMNHGAQEPCFGVKIEDMKKIQKRVKMDYQLALDLFDTGIADAQYLAGLIADDAKMTKKDLNKWVKNSVWGMVSEYSVPWVAASGRFGRELALEWIDKRAESIALAGWQTYSSLVAITADEDLELDEVRSLLDRAATTIHDQPNRVKYVMNSFVISVACHVKPLHDHGVRAANSIGEVSVELVGACKIPFAPDYIKKFKSRSAVGKKRKSAKC